MQTTIYKNEAGVIDKVILTSEGTEDSNQLIEFVKHKEEAQGSGYTHGWDKGFAQENDPYGIQAEYLPQSANPDAAVEPAVEPEVEPEAPPTPETIN